MARSYDNRQRAQRAAETAERIAEVTEVLLTSEREDAVTLKAIAEGAGVTVQTVLRHMGSREGCIDAVVERVSARVDAERGQSAPGDIDGAIEGLLAHYESTGPLVLNLVGQAPASELARRHVVAGREYHRAWVEQCFGPHLRSDAAFRHRDIDALVAATDLSAWKLLRLDLERSPEAVAAVMDRLVRAVLESS